MTLLHPSAEPQRDGLTIIGKPSWSPRALTRTWAPSSRNVSYGNATWVGVRMPAAPTTVVAIDLSNATRQAEPMEPTNGTLSRSNTSRSEPSSPASPCKTGKTTEPLSSASRESKLLSTSDSTTS